MGHHRADVPSPARAGSGTPNTPGRRAANVPVDSPSTTVTLQVADIQAEAARHAYVGKRRAAVPASPEVETHRAAIVSDGPFTDHVDQVLASLEPVDQTTSFETEDTARLTIDRSHPEPAPATSSITTTYVNDRRVEPGKRRAVKHAGSRGPLFKAMPSAPVLLGVAALAITIGGVLTVNDQEPVSAVGRRAPTHASALSGSSGIGTVVGGERADRHQRRRCQSGRRGPGPGRRGRRGPPAVAEGMAEVRVGALPQLAR